MVSFIGREPELEMLNAAYRAESSALVPIYGRRRIGKSTLIVRFLEAYPGSIYLLGKEGPAALQMQELLAVASERLNVPLLARAEPKSWADALDLVVDAWAGPGKVILALDEFQWMVGASPELPSVLQALWDRKWRDSGKVMLILCGSLVGFMEREILGRKSPLFGRRTGQIHLRPFGFREAAAFHPAYGLLDAARTYALCGGVPLYLRAFDDALSVEQNIIRACLDEFAPLHQEPHFLLREELRDVRNYYAVLMALASGSAPSRDIAKATGIDRSLSYYLDQLVELRYVRRRYPLTGKAPGARSVRFVLDDALLSFWFRFIYPNISFLRHMGPERTFATRIRPQLDAWYGARFEVLCREALPLLYAREGISAAFEVGEFWSKDVQIDVVGLRQDSRTDIGECKWGPVASPASIAREIAAKRGRYPNARNATVACRVFAAQHSVPPARARELGVIWHDLADIYGVDAG